MNFDIDTTKKCEFRPPCLSAQVILISRGNAEVFNDVLRVRYRSDNALIIEHGEDGRCTHSYRPLQDVYNVIYNEPGLIKYENT